MHMACIPWGEPSFCRICTSCWQQQLQGPQIAAAVCEQHPTDLEIACSVQLRYWRGSFMKMLTLGPLSVLLYYV